MSEAAPAGLSFCDRLVAGPDVERMDVADTASISASIADRYAGAVFDLAQEAGSLDALQKDVALLGDALKESADLRDLMHSPLYSRAEQEAGIGAVAGKLGLSDMLGNTLRLMARKRRLFVTPDLLEALTRRIADAKGIVFAEVTSAKALTKGQSEKLAAVLKSKVGSDVEINQIVDANLIAGLIVKLGSQMIDTSIRSKLAALQNTMKEAG